ncbi:imidazole glycerol phosphate synthase subunit HisF [candidate division KSB3 bacterium]|uniref:Imidazole glycerol phosphate synthase subunit HisF n=1 Tax=candidate division KSB3 bacterium TaxID=2044937 RepID=A0A2G6E4H7_9BACT|nr:MAG: imidazole glycerol phosphate synthase subunit HisF [candidate division KSB3 bacterium]PIE29150.1 MAG: imidazole glycerol phosphate synthase subunit HisF [candidate division KSB3 bacterium]
MLAKRVIPCLDVDDGRVVKGVNFQEIRDAGDPVEFARFYNEQGADELVFLDIGASYKSREILIDVVRQVSNEVFIPLTVGGGIRSTEDMRKLLLAGADKVAMCTSAIENPKLLSEGAEIFGSQCIVLSIDAKKVGDTWQAYTHGARHDSGIDVLEWAERGEQLGCGEILLNSIDMDGTRQGYDLELNAMVSGHAGIPVIASGGAGNIQHMVDAITLGKADAVLLASLVHFGEYGIPEIKKYMRDKGVVVRW